VVGFCLQLLAFTILLGTSIWSESSAIRAGAYLAFVGLPIWVALFLTLKQIRRVRDEEFETAELLRARDPAAESALFEDAGEELAIEKNRIKWMVKYLLPSVTILLSLAILLHHFLGWNWTVSEAFDPQKVTRTSDSTIMAVFVVFVGLACFWFARYSLALAKMPEWRLLHAGAVCMVANALACIVLVIALMASSAIEWLEPLATVVIRLALLVIGIELAINFILDFYRPRSPGYIARPSFDSRLLGLVGEPGGIAKSIADAINYQFGFEVSKTWFYQFLQRWMLPLIVVTAILVLALTSLVVINPNEEAMVLRFGKPLDGPPTLSPGIHWKLPYPIDIVYRAPATSISEIVVGEASLDTTQSEDRAILWTKTHKYVPELMILVASPDPEQNTGDEVESASPRQDSTDSGKSVAVSLIMVSIPIEYRIKDITKYLFGYDRPEKVMEDVVYQLVSDFAAGVDLDELIGPGRERFNKELHEKFQSRMDELSLGIELVFVGIRGAHPPPKDKVAATFQAVVSAEISRGTTVNTAVGLAHKTLTATAGSVELAVLLDEAILKRDALESAPDTDPQALLEARRRVDELLTDEPPPGILPLGGEAAAIIAEAQALRNREISSAIAKTLTFGAEVSAWQASEELYTARKRLGIFNQLQLVRKYLIVGDPSSVIVEYEDRAEAGLDRVLREGLEDELEKLNP